MKDYKEFQFGTLIFILIIPVQLALTYAYIYKLGNNPIDFTGFIMVNILFVSVYLLFYGMTTIVKQDKITIVYGIGIIRINIRLNRIKAMREVTNPAYAGWGIRFLPNGILYNIRGSKALELAFHDSKRFVRIGSKNPSILMEEIDKRLSKT
ncbi:MAG: hypothetical protein ACO1N7_09205 [Sphingobacteriaceae bacterium]